MITFRGFLLAYEEGRDEAGDDAEEKRLPQLSRGRRARRDGARAGGALDVAALALHRGEPRQGARGARHRPPVDVRGDHGDDPRPRLRAQAGPGARAGVPRLRRRQPARAAFPAARRLRVHRAHGGRSRRDRRRRRVAHRVARPLLLRQRHRRGRPEGARRTASRRHRRARGQHRRRCRAPTSSSASASTARTSSAATTARRCRPTSRRTS